MIFWKRKHNLPKFPDTAASLFLSLCQPLTPSQAEDLRMELTEAYREMLNLAESSPNMNTQRLNDIYKVGSYLLSHYESFPQRKQSLIVGGIRYFIAEDDALNDLVFYTGLDDDAKILNYVLEELGIEDMYIRLDGGF
jgi:uncharacterized membrane protein YkvA (DUF1232 family)